MKFGKNLLRVIELSNPEWGPYWINYKHLKKIINEIVESSGGNPGGAKPLANPSRPDEISKSSREVHFFMMLRKELKKSTEFFRKAEIEYQIRWDRIWDSYLILKENTLQYDSNAWARLLNACVKFYKDVLLLENFAIMSYCGFSKILKKHDKLTGFVTREAFMKNVVNQQNFTHYPDVLALIKKSEHLFRSIQAMETVVPLQSEEKLFIEAIIGLNYQASRLQEVEKQDTLATPEGGASPVERRADNPPPKVMPPKSASREEVEKDQKRNLEISVGLDNATSILVETAAKLSHYHHPTSPTLSNVLSWMELTKPTVEQNIDVHGEVSTTDVEEGDAGIVLGSVKRSAEDYSSNEEEPLQKSLRVN